MEFPEFEITDLCGNHYSNKSRGKPQYRTWFINCKTCEAEFPELNELVNKHFDSYNILFLSLALNSKSALKEFLETQLLELKLFPIKKNSFAKN